MYKRPLIILAVVFGLVAISTPILISLHMARKQSFSEQMARATLLADDVLRRSDESSDQVLAAFVSLKAAAAVDPCSDENIHLMARIAVSAYHLVAVGYVAGDRLMCSSFGRHGAGIPVGMPEYLSVWGTQLRPSVELPSLANARLLLTTDAASGYTALVHRDQPINVFVDKPNISVGVFGFSGKKLLLGRGAFKAEWMRTLGNAYQAELTDGEHLVAIRRSRKYDFATFAAIPMTSVDEGIGHLSLVLLPIGLVASIILALAILYLTKLQLTLPAALKVALKRNEFFLHYQPVVDLRTGKWVGAEALIRWRRSDGTLVRPDLFIPVAEESGLIQRLSERVTEIVARDAAGLFKEYPDFHLAINLSPADMHSERTIELLDRLCRDTHASAGNLVVETTERGFMKADVAREVIRALRANGIQVAIDDFGTGYSSLSSLGTFDLDFLKIDKSFIDTIGTDAPTSQVVLHIIAMAKDLKLEMIAEGVETMAQAEFLRQRGVRYAQGWLFAKAMPFDELLMQLVQKKVA